MSTPCSATYASTSSCVQRAIGEILTLRRFSSQPTTGVFARVGDSSRRSPVAQASYAAQALLQRLDLAQRAAQVGVAVVQLRPVLGVLLGDGLPRGERDDVDVHHGLDRVPGADGLREVVAGVEEDHVHAGPAARGRRGGRRPRPPSRRSRRSARRRCRRPSGGSPARRRPPGRAPPARRAPAGPRSVGARA